MSFELEANLRELASAGPVELRENGARVAPLSALSWEVRGQGEKPLRHLEQGDIARYGYFPGIELQSAPPLVYLVVPALRFHPAMDTLVRSLSPQLDIVRVGLAENWRRGPRVVLRQYLSQNFFPPLQNPS